MEETSQIENLIFKHPIVQTLLSEVGKSEEYDINIAIPIRKQFIDEGKLIIAGYASVEIIDSQKELIPLEVLKEAWDKFSENEDFMIGTLMHSNIPVIKILKDYKDSKGELWKSGVDETGLFIVAVVNDSIEKGKQARELIEKGALAGFSIGGEALASSVHCEGKCFTRIDKMELHEIAVVDKPANKASVFTIVKRLKENKSGENMPKSKNSSFRKKIEKLTFDEIKEKIMDLKRKYKKLSDQIWPRSQRLEGEELKEAELKLEMIDVEVKAYTQALGERIIQKSKEVKKPFTFNLDISKMDKALEIMEKEVISKPEKPHKAEWDKCEGKARGIPSIKDPAAFCGNLWYNDRSKFNAFIKEEKKSECGCPVNKTITTKSINRLDKTLSLLDKKRKKPKKPKKPKRPYGSRGGGMRPRTSLKSNLLVNNQKKKPNKKVKK